MTPTAGPRAWRRPTARRLFGLFDPPLPSGVIPPNGRSILVSNPDGGHQAYLYTNSAAGVASSYATNQLPNTTPYTNTFDNSDLDVRNTFHWGPRQYAHLSTTNIASFTANDFKAGRMKHWLKSVDLAGTTQTISNATESVRPTTGASRGKKSGMITLARRTRSMRGRRYCHCLQGRFYRMAQRLIRGRNAIIWDTCWRPFPLIHRTVRWYCEKIPILTPTTLIY